MSTILSLNFEEMCYASHISYTFYFYLVLLFIYSPLFKYSHGFVPNHKYVPLAHRKAPDLKQRKHFPNPSSWFFQAFMRFRWIRHANIL